MKLKKVLVLALCLALVCSLSVTAFAASTFEPHIRYFADGNTRVEFYGQLTQTMMTGLAEVTSIYGEGYAEVDVYYQYKNNSGRVLTGQKHEVELNMVYVSASHTDNGTPCTMLNGDYYFWADVPNEGTWDEYEVDNVYLTYP